jgi:hypothetical protein
MSIDLAGDAIKDIGSRGAVQAATRATYAAFIASGFACASWAARIPQVRDGLDLNPSELGYLLLSIAAGSVVALPLSGRIVARFGSRRAAARGAPGGSREPC